jgi:hypothetical protein
MTFDRVLSAFFAGVFFIAAITVYAADSRFFLAYIGISQIFWLRLFNDNRNK